jgi:chemotaxis response regulator CheB
MKKTTVLLVEEDRLIRTSLQLALPRLGFTLVGTAANRDQTLRLLRALEPDVVVMSPRVLEKTGFGLVQEVLDRKSTPVLLLPGDTRDLSARALPPLPAADVRRLAAVIRMMRALLSQRGDILN